MKLLANIKIFSLSVFFLLLLTGCSTYTVNQSNNVCVPKDNRIAVFMFNNNTQTPQANNAAMSITADLLRQKGFDQLYVYHPSSNSKNVIPGLEPTPSTQAQIRWARSQGIRYAVSGSVNEWQYKIGLDGEPVVGVSLQLIDLDSNTVIWSSVGAVHGSPHAGLAVTAQDLINGMLRSFR